MHMHSECGEKKVDLLMLRCIVLTQTAPIANTYFKPSLLGMEVGTFYMRAAGVVAGIVS